LERERWQRLTPREREVVGRIVAGRRPVHIAAEFVVSVATVRSQIRSILAKLEVGSQLEVAALVRRHERC
jgi:DNA-binding CsgD family transcriptional regulator